MTRSSIWNGSGAEALSTSSSAVDHLDLPGRQLGIGVALGSQRHLAGDLDAVLVPQVVCARRRQHLVTHHHLDHPGGVPQIKERHPTMVTAAGDPAGQGDGGSGMLGAKRAGTVGAHHELLPFQTGE